MASLNTPPLFTETSPTNNVQSQFHIEFDKFDLYAERAKRRSSAGRAGAAIVRRPAIADQWVSSCLGEDAPLCPAWRSCTTRSSAAICPLLGQQTAEGRRIWPDRVGKQLRSIRTF
jgi:hypothetical protein